MGSVQLLLGRTRQRRRRALPAEHLSGVDGLGRPTFLYVTDTRRKQQTVEREFLAWRRDTPTFSPQVRVLGELFEALHLRHGDGGAILGPRLRALVAERVLAEGRWPWLAALAKHRAWPVAEALADLEQRLAEARCDLPEEVPHGAEIGDAVRALRTRLQAMPGRITPSAALEGLLALFDAPPPALVQWLRATHAVVVDDVLHQSPLRTAVLTALCQAWATAGAHVVVAFESGRGRGGREAAAFFDYDEVTGSDGPLRPFAATRSLRRALFEELVAIGEGARITVAMADRVADADDPDDEEEPPDLVDEAYGDRAPVGRASVPAEVRFVQHTDADSEARHVAAEVKEALRAGEAPADCLVAVAGLSGEANRWRAAFEDAGVPCATSAGQPLAEAPVARLLLRMARWALDGQPAAELLGILGSDLALPVARASVPALLRRVKSAGIRSGAPSTWAPALETLSRRTREPVDVAELAAVEATAAPLLCLSRDGTPGEHRQRLLDAATALGVPDRLARCPDPKVATEGLQAWGSLLRCLDDLVRDLTAVDAGPLPAAAWAEALDRAVATARWRAEDGGVARVALVDAREIRGLTPRRLWLAGLTRGSFPRPEASSFLLPRPARRALGSADPVAEARYLLASAIRNATHTDGMRLVISWPASRDGGVVARAAALDEILRATPELVERAGPPPIAGKRAAARAAAKPGWEALAGEPGLVSARREAHVARSGPDLGPWDGMIGPLPDPPRTLRVTSLERFLRCPARFAYAEILGLRPDVAFEPEVDPARRGAAVHRILERFYQDRRLQPVQGLAGDALAAASARLHAVAEAVFDELAAEGGFEAPYLAYERDRWLAGLADERPAGLLRAWLEAEVAFPSTLAPVAVEEASVGLPVGPVRVVGRIDRVDRAGGGLLVTDYKTGASPSVDDVARGLALQPVAYAAAVEARSPGTPVASVYQELARPDDVTRRGWTGDPAVLERLAPSRAATLPLDGPARDRLLAHAGTAAERLLAGRFHATLASPEEAGCASCDFRRICRTDPGRVVTTEDAQRPLEPS
jgi:RecB family exonuclease